MTGTKEDYINYRIAKSKEIFSDAHLLADNRRWNSCISRLYYSSFYLASVLYVFLFCILYKSEITSD